MDVVIVGAGVIGAALAYELSVAGARVTVLDAGLPGSGASGRSFGWINASFHANPAHFRLRQASMDRYRQWQASGTIGPGVFTGALWWEEEGAGFDAMAQQLRDLGYPVEEHDAAAFARLEPAVAAPPRALSFGTEGALDPGALARRLLDLAAARGARVLAGCRVDAVRHAAGRATGVETPAGPVQADRVVIAGGNGAPDLLAPLGVALPMLPRPGLILRTRPVARLLHHVLVAPGQEFRQDEAGRIHAPCAASHQGDTSTRVTDPEARIAETMDRLRALLPGVALDLEQAGIAFRPVPGDGLPAIGPAGPQGVYVAVMHSGATLAAIVGHLGAREILTGSDEALLAPFRPARFG